MDQNDSKLSAIAAFVNKYPNIDISSYSLDGDLISGEPSTVVISLDREVDEDEGVDTVVSAQFYPIEKIENCEYLSIYWFVWWQTANKGG
jgi:pre-mRNA-splicing helicase BRR2